MMDKKRAKQILVAHACCMLNDKKLCRECPWRNTEDCSNTSFLEVLEEAILAVKGEYKTKMKLEDIKIPKTFAETIPNEKKITECTLEWKTWNRQDRYIAVNHNGYLVDGYVMYCVLKERGVEEAEVKVTRRRSRKKTTTLETPKYRDNPTTYIYGTHPNSKSTKERIWRVPESWGNWADDVQIGDVIFGVTNRGCSPVVVTRIEVLDKCPVGFPVKRVANKGIRRNGECIHE